jgi:hypothetical protein
MGFLTFDRRHCEREAVAMGIPCPSSEMDRYCDLVQRLFEQYNSDVARATCHKMNNDADHIARPSYKIEWAARQALS